MKHSRLITVVTVAALAFMANSAQAMTSIDASQSSTKITGQAEAGIGNSLDVTGDVDGDGYPDLLVSYYNDSTSTDSAFLLYGDENGFPTSATIDEADAMFEGVLGEGYGYGAAVSFAGDVNGDGYDDMLISNSYTSDIFLVYGQADIFAGSYTLESMSDDSVDIFAGETSADYAGVSIVGRGDVNSDGLDDFVIGAHWNSSKAGAAYLFYGSSSKRTGSTSLVSADAKFSGEVADDYAGNYISLGDVNADGFSDIMVSASGYDSYRGRVYLIYGGADNLASASLSTADTIYTGAEEYDGIGGTATATGDVNGDGYKDLVFGMAEASTLNNDIPGGVYVVYGSSASLTSITITSADAKITVADSNGRYSFFPVSGMDLNNDTYDDIVIAVGDGATADNQVYVIFGSASGLATSIEATTDSDVVIAGETSADGFGADLDLTYVGNDQFADIVASSTYEGTGGSNAGAVYLLSLYQDSDGDGVAGGGGIITGSDCDDSDNTVATEQTYYIDNDGDGLGDASSSTSLCSSSIPDGYAANSSDDDDTAFGPIAELTVTNGQVTIDYASGFSQTVTPFSAGSNLQAKVSTDSLRWVVTNGKSIRAFFEGNQTASKKMYSKGPKQMAKGKLRVVSMYSNYDSILYMSARNKTGRVVVVRLKSDNTLAKLKKHSVALETKNPKKQTMKVKLVKHKFRTRFGSGNTKTTNWWKVKKKGQVTKI
ncbi:MAG: hypothetical protein CO132_04230 [Candidatus Kerfeldbacteria bacterium CG_4_9_14_3_um_filter_45_8]|nr:MAG: hypothetical protein CO132_04230 [Candidatus Kerfeldbacteria bacterium CG_4_9_14_3_um_filter_45_8]